MWKFLMLIKEFEKFCCILKECYSLEERKSYCDYGNLGIAADYLEEIGEKLKSAALRYLIKENIKPFYVFYHYTYEWTISNCHDRNILNIIAKNNIMSFSMKSVA